MKINQATIQFYGDLRDFLKSKDEVIEIDFKGKQSVKHIIESLGVPHTEVEQILVNHQPKFFTYILKNNDNVEAIPWRAGYDMFLKYKLEPCFILDNHLGKLATFLRIVGIDTYYRNDLQDDEIVNYLKNHERILLTRDRRLLMRREINWGYCVRKDHPKDQLTEILYRFGLHDKLTPLNRCLSCNRKLIPIDKLSIIHRLEPLTKLYYEEFHICPGCDQIYWKGSHYDHMLEFIKEIGRQK